jgi:flavin reductase (DIM6/NTAB) family NADH-FMN oxidoreductase RutF
MSDLDDVFRERSRELAPEVAESGPGRAEGSACVTPDEFRRLMSAFPTGVAVVTTLAEDGSPRGLTCSALASVSLRPATLLVCFSLRSETLVAVEKHRKFGVNLLHARAQQTARLFSAPLTDRFSRIRWRSAADGLPWLVEDAFAYAGCAVVERIAAGDHVIILGEVRDIAVSAGMPLLYGLREFSAWPKEREWSA